MSIYLGIDFGTSTNYITRWNEKRRIVEPVPNIDSAIYGESIFPNVIYYKSKKEIIVGKLAEKLMSIDPQNGVSGVKRRLIEDNWTYNIPILKEKYSTNEVVIDIFSYIKDRVSENNAGEKIDGVVISVPYSYGNKERLKIKNAAEAAGLNVIDLIEEPIAAAISYGIFNKKSTMGHSENIMVFDFGGGTLDITVFSYNKYTNGEIFVEVLNTEGIRDFGGKIIDEILLSKILNKANINLSEITDEDKKNKFHEELLSKVIDIKESSQYWEEDEEDEICDNISGIMIDVSISSKEIEDWLRGTSINEKLRSSIENALMDSGKRGLDYEDIDRILLVGGSSNLNIVKKEIKNLFNKEAEEVKEIEKDQLVGYGAGIYCGLKVSNENKITVIQKLSYSIGVKLGTKFDKILLKNSNYGEFSTPREYTLVESTNNRDIEIYQGNSIDIKKCFLIGKIPVSDLNLKCNQNIEISLGTDKDGMVLYKLYVDGKCVKNESIK